MFREEALELRTTVRYLRPVVDARVQTANREHAARQSVTTPTVVLEDIQEELDRLAARIERLTEASLQTARRNPLLARRLELLLTIKGVAEASAVQILGALSVLPGDMTARQWVAHAGLDPRPTRSGTSVAKPDRLSKAGNARLRSALFMPAQSASRTEPRVRAFKEELVGRGKRPLQAITAVMRKLLHAIHGMWKTDTPWDPTHFRAVAAAASRHPPASSTNANPGAVRPLRTFAPSREAVVPEQNGGSVP